MHDAPTYYWKVICRGFHDGWAFVYDHARWEIGILVVTVLLAVFGDVGPDVTGTILIAFGALGVFVGAVLFGNIAMAPVRLDRETLEALRRVEVALSEAATPKPDDIDQTITRLKEKQFTIHGRVTNLATVLLKNGGRFVGAGLASFDLQELGGDSETGNSIVAALEIESIVMSNHVMPTSSAGTASRRQSTEHDVYTLSGHGKNVLLRLQEMNRT